MKIIKNISSIKKTIKSSAVTIGTFDGMHKGHHYLIDKLLSFSSKKNVPSALITFTPNPYTIINNIESRDYHIISREKKYNLIEKAGVDILLELKFDSLISNMSAYEFLRKIIVETFNPKDIVIGHDHHFGKNRGGNSEFLEKYQDEFAYNLHLVEAFALNEKTVSSSLIRGLLLSGDLNLANAYLGWNYQISGLIIAGSKLGREISFPTANISLDSVNQLIPSDGVYFMQGIIEGEKYTGMCNIGCKPTFKKNKDKTIEVHLFDYNKYDLYDKYITIEFVDYIRSEKKFINKEDLKEQLKKDKEYCMNILN